MEMLDIMEKIDQFVIQRDKTRQAERAERYGGSDREAFYVSEAGKCPRKVAYDFFGMPRKQMAGRVLRLLENGDYLQSRYSKYFKDMGVWLAEEVSVNVADREDVPFNLSGRLDIVINARKMADPTFTGDPTVDEMAIIEMKSINTWGFKDVAADLQPQPEHYLQIMIYMWLTGIHQGWVLYEDKNDQTAVACPVTYDERVIYGKGTEDGRGMGIVQEFMALAEVIEGKKVPERCSNANQSKFPCKWKSDQCDYYDHCWNPAHDGYLVPKKQELIEVAGRTFNLNALPDGVTKEKVMEMKAFWDMMNGVQEVPEQAITVDTFVGELPQANIPVPELPQANFPVGHTEIIAEVDGVAAEFEFAGGRAIKCFKCSKTVIFQRKGKGGTVRCPHCQTSNFVLKLAGRE